MDAVWDGRLDGSSDEAGFGDRSMGGSNVGGECGALHCNQWGFCSIAVRKCMNRWSCGLGWCVGSDQALVAMQSVAKLLWAIFFSISIC